MTYKKLGSSLFGLTLLVSVLAAELPARAGEGEGGINCAGVTCGDVNGDGDEDISDPIHLLRYLFQNGPPPTCGASVFCCADANGDESLDISDPVYLFRWLFAGGSDPACPDACELRVRIFIEPGIDGGGLITANDGIRQATVSVHDTVTGTQLYAGTTDAEGIATFPCVDPPFTVTSQMDMDVWQDGSKVFRVASTIYVESPTDGELGILMFAPETEYRPSPPSSPIVGRLTGLPALDENEILIVNARLVADDDNSTVSTVLTPGDVLEDGDPTSAPFWLDVGQGRFEVWAVIEDGAAPPSDRHIRLAALYPEAVETPTALALDLEFESPQQRVEFERRCLHLNGAIGVDGDQAYINVYSQVSTPSGLVFELFSYHMEGELDPFPSSLPDVSVAVVVPDPYILQREIIIEYDETRSQDGSFLPEDSDCTSDVRLAPLVDGEVSGDPDLGVCVDLHGPETEGYVFVIIEGPGGGLETDGAGGEPRAIDGILWVLHPAPEAGAAASLCLPRPELPMLRNGIEYTFNIESGQILGDPPVTREDLRSFDLDTRVWPTLEGRSTLDSDLILKYTACDTADDCGRRVKVFFIPPPRTLMTPLITANDSDLEAAVSVYEIDTGILYCPVMTDAAGIASLPCVEPPFAVTAQLDMGIWQGEPRIFRVASTIFIEEPSDGDLGIFIQGPEPEFFLVATDPPTVLSGSVSGIPELDPGEILTVYAELLSSDEDEIPNTSLPGIAPSEDFELELGPGTYKVWAVIEDSTAPEFQPRYRLAAVFPEAVTLTSGASITLGTDLDFDSEDQRVEFGIQDCVHLNGVGGFDEEWRGLDFQSEIMSAAGYEFAFFSYYLIGEPGPPPTSIENISVALSAPAVYGLRHAVEVEYDSDSDQSGELLPGDSICSSDVRLPAIPDAGVEIDPEGRTCLQFDVPDTGEIVLVEVGGPGGDLMTSAGDGPVRPIDEILWFFFPDPAAGAEGRFCFPPTARPMLRWGESYEVEIEAFRFTGEPEVTGDDFHSFDLDTRVWPSLGERSHLEADRILSFETCEEPEDCEP